MKFIKKPIVIEAFQVGFDFEPDWFKKRKDYTSHHLEHHTEYSIKTLEGTMRATYGDWVIKGVKNEIYPCKPDVFEESYEAYRPTSAVAKTQGD